MVARAWSMVVVAALAAVSVPLFAGTPASFRGKVVELPVGKAKSGTIFVMSRNGSVRKVEVKDARVVYAQDFPAKLRQSQPEKALKHGTEVRVTAEENGAGLWHARLVEILTPAGARRQAKRHPSPVPKEESHPQPTLARRTA
jgi:hypothetical protein